jgi:hypothetical protein
VLISILVAYTSARFLTDAVEGLPPSCSFVWAWLPAHVRRRARSGPGWRRPRMRARLPLATRLFVGLWRAMMAAVL